MSREKKGVTKVQEIANLLFWLDFGLDTKRKIAKKPVNARMQIGGSQTYLIRRGV
jgi:hypothetical protein